MERVHILLQQVIELDETLELLKKVFGPKERELSEENITQVLNKIDSIKEERQMIAEEIHILTEQHRKYNKRETVEKKRNEENYTKNVSRLLAICPEISNVIEKELRV
jgi:uncharacterized membrane protein YgaE (UPF0421/DUF939 family)